AIESYAMMASTDLWGDMAYSDAFKFNENGGVYQPKFDTQEEIYNQIFANLDEARQFLSMDDGGNAPGSADLFYGGNAAQWIKFCNLLEARGHLHLADRDPSQYSSVLSALNAGAFESSADNASLLFGAGATENAPWYQYIQQRDDIEVGSFYVGLMEGLNDPRINSYGALLGLPHPIFTGGQDVQIMSYTEQLFIQAEAELMAGNSDAAYSAYLDGILSSMAEASVSESDAMAYISQATVGVGAGDLTLENIMVQKYIAMYLLIPESF